MHDIVTKHYSDIMFEVLILHQKSIYDYIFIKGEAHHASWIFINLN